MSITDTGLSQGDLQRLKDVADVVGHYAVLRNSEEQADGAARGALDDERA